jgi:hypothetical protein
MRKREKQIYEKRREKKKEKDDAPFILILVI